MKKYLYVLNDVAFDEGFIPYVIEVTADSMIDASTISSFIREGIEIATEEEQIADGAIDIIFDVLKDNGLEARKIEYCESYNLPG